MWSHLFIQYSCLQSLIHSPVSAALSPRMFHSQHYVVVLARSTINILDPHRIQTQSFWFHVTKECSANVHQALFHIGKVESPMSFMSSGFLFGEIIVRG